MSNTQSPPAADTDGCPRPATATEGMAMGIVDAAGCWTEVNAALERRLGRTAASLCGHSMLECVHPDDIESARRQLSALANGDVASVETGLAWVAADGTTRRLQLGMAALRDASGHTVRHVVQLRDGGSGPGAGLASPGLEEEVERRVAERTAELVEDSRQQALFAHGVSHDLRAPLRAIDGFAQLLASSQADRLDDTGKGYLERILAATQRMGGLIDALLELSRAMRGELKTGPVDLSLLAEWSCAELHDAAPGRASEIDIAPGLSACGDERYLKILLDQLLGNAFNFAVEGEPVRIEVRGGTVDGVLRMSVRDAGSGFDMRYAEKMFEPFQRLHAPEQGGGHGLGLAIAKRIVDRHGGRLWAQSEPGAGATFHVELPGPATSEDAMP